MVKADVEVVEDSRLAVVSQEVEEASQEAVVVASVVEAEVANHHLSLVASSPSQSYASQQLGLLAICGFWLCH